MDMSQTEMDMSQTELDMSQTEMDMSQTEMDMSQTEMDMSLMLSCYNLSGNQSEIDIPGRYFLSFYPSQTFLVFLAGIIRP